MDIGPWQAIYNDLVTSQASLGGSYGLAVAVGQANARSPTYEREVHRRPVLQPSDVMRPVVANAALTVAKGCVPDAYVKYGEYLGE